MAKKVYQVTDSKGRVHKRTTMDRTYTHAVVIDFAAVPADPERNFPAHKPSTRVEWAGRPDLAQKNAASWRAGGREVEVLEAVQIK